MVFWRDEDRAILEIVYSGGQLSVCFDWQDPQKQQGVVYQEIEVTTLLPERRV